MLFLVNTLSQILDITTTIDDDIKKYDLMFIRYYVPWCAYSQISEKEWIQLENNYKQDTKVMFADADCSAIGNDCRQLYNVHGYPDFVLYQKGKFVKQFRPTLPRDAQVLYEWLNRVINELKQQNH